MLVRGVHRQECMIFVRLEKLTVERSFCMTTAGRVLEMAQRDGMEAY